VGLDGSAQKDNQFSSETGGVIMSLESPVSLDEAKDHLRVVTSLCLAATDFAEKFQNRTFVKRTRTMVLDAFPTVIRPPWPPLISAVILYVDADGADQTLAAANYRVDAVTEPGRITVAYGLSWPTIRAVTNAITITYLAGYGTAAAVPDDVKAAIKLIVGHLYEHREAMSEGQIYEVPMAAKSLLYTNRIMLETR
jgi:uncharacterized phiE125 gp8 family phage protein